jgi:hypothetical protein
MNKFFRWLSFFRSHKNGLITSACKAWLMSRGEPVMLYPKRTKGGDA